MVPARKESGGYTNGQKQDQPQVCAKLVAGPYFFPSSLKAEIQDGIIDPGQDLNYNMLGSKAAILAFRVLKPPVAIVVRA